MRRCASVAAARLSLALPPCALTAALPPSRITRRLRLSSSFLSCRASSSAASVRDGRSAAGGVEAYLLPRAFLVTTQTLPGHRIERVVGLVSGNTVRVRNAVADYFAGLRALFGGEIATYTDLMMEAREEATERMIEEAKELGANAIVNIRVETSNLAANASEIYTYGTAVIVKPESEQPL